MLPEMIVLRAGRLRASITMISKNPCTGRSGESSAICTRAHDEDGTAFLHFHIRYKWHDRPVQPLRLAKLFRAEISSRTLQQTFTCVRYMSSGGIVKNVQGPLVIFVSKVSSTFGLWTWHKSGRSMIAPAISWILLQQGCSCYPESHLGVMNLQACIASIHRSALLKHIAPLSRHLRLADCTEYPSKLNHAGVKKKE